MISKLTRALAWFAMLWSNVAFPLGLELDFGGSLGKEKWEPRSSTTISDDNPLVKASKELSNFFSFGFRTDARLLVLHNRTLHLGVGAGLGYERASSSTNVKIENLPEIKVQLSFYRLMLEPNAKLTFFPSKDVGLGVGVGYYLGLTGDSESVSESNGTSKTEKQKIKTDGAFRLRLGASFVLEGQNKPHIQASYQLTAGGSLKADSANANEVDLSGHSFVLSYVHPIIFSNAASDYDYEEVRPRGRRGDTPPDDRSQRRRKQRPRY